MHVILCDGEETSTGEFDIPFRYETEGSDEKAVDYDATVTPISCRARVDGERIGVDAELAVSLRTLGESRFESLCEAKFGDPVSRSGAVYTICYPAPDDTLWSVAKRYHRSVSAVSDMNSLAGSPAADAKDSLSGVRFLLV